MALDRGIRGSESPSTNDSNLVHFTAKEAYSSTDTHTYNCVFTNKATPDSGKSDTQLNNELNSPTSIYSPEDTTGGAIGDLQKGIKSDSRTRHDLMNAISDASTGDIDSAMMHLRQASGDLNDAGGKIDSGLSKLGDGGQSLGSQTIQRSMRNEADCTENIQKAEQLLREGDTEGAINAMSKGVREVAHRQHQTRNGIASLQGDNSAIYAENFASGTSGYDNRSGNSNGYGNTNTSFYPGFNQGDSSFDNQQRVTRSNNGGWNSTQPFTPDDSGSYQPYGSSSDNSGNYGSGGDYNGNYGSSDSQNGPSLSLNLPNPFDMINRLPNPMDMLGGNSSGSGSGSPFDMLSGLPNPMDMLGGGSSGGGGLPNPFNMFGSGSDSDSGDDQSWPNPAKGLSSFAQDPLKPVENLLTPPKSPKDLVHKLLDPIGLFG